jgi:hypothetical protein
MVQKMGKVKDTPVVDACNMRNGKPISNEDTPQTTDVVDFVAAGPLEISLHPLSLRFDIYIPLAVYGGYGPGAPLGMD